MTEPNRTRHPGGALSALAPRGAGAAPGRRRGWDVAAALALAAIVWVTYGNSLDAGFAFDSGAIILSAPQIRSATAENVASSSATTTGGR